MQDQSAQLCIIGAGPAGLTVAREFVGGRVDVLVLESGGSPEISQAQDLNAGDNLGVTYSGLRATRHRGLGGTVQLWNTVVGDQVGAKFAPLDPGDFETSPAGLSGWPIGYYEMSSYYERAQSVCGLGSYRYDAAHWQTDDVRPFDLGDTSLTTRVYQFGSASQWLDDHVASILRAENIRLVSGVTAGHFIGQDSHGVRRLHVKDTVSGADSTITADVFVLAAGAVENARLLMLSELDGVRIGNRLLGRCFMEHPRDGSLRLAVSGGDVIDKARFYDMRPARDGTIVAGRLARRGEQEESARRINFSVTLLPQARPPGLAGRLLRRIGLAEERRGYGWSLLPDAPSRYEHLGLIVNLEQAPSLSNRIVLAGVRDRLGYPRSQLVFHWRDDEQQAADAVAGQIAQAMADAQLGDVERLLSVPVDLNAHHHAGTTRMADSSADGVIDPSCRVFGLDNVYVAGASAFPTAGFANPMLTIVAMAIRLADHLKTRL